MISVTGSARNDESSCHTSRSSTDRMSPTSSAIDTTLTARGPSLRAPMSQSCAAPNPRRCAINTSESTNITMSGPRFVQGALRGRPVLVPSRQHHAERRTNVQLREGLRRDSLRNSTARGPGAGESLQHGTRPLAPPVGRVPPSAPRRGRCSSASYTTTYITVRLDADQLGRAAICNELCTATKGLTKSTRKLAHCRPKSRRDCTVREAADSRWQSSQTRRRVPRDPHWLCVYGAKARVRRAPSAESTRPWLEPRRLPKSGRRLTLW